MKLILILQFQSLHHLQLAPSPPPLVLRRTDYSSIGFGSPRRPTPVPANSVGFPRHCRSWPRISLTSPRRLTALTPPRASSSSASFAGLHPKKPKFRKQHRGRMKGTSSRGDHVCFGKYGLQALEPAWITARQIEAGRRAMTRIIRRGGKIVIRIFPDKPVTKKPAGTRMGSGKGNPEFWVAVVKPGRIIFEMSGVREGAARRAIAVAASKMPIRTKFVTSGSG